MGDVAEMCFPSYLAHTWLLSLVQECESPGTPTNTLSLIPLQGSTRTSRPAPIHESLDHCAPTRMRASPQGLFYLFPLGDTPSFHTLKTEMSHPQRHQFNIKRSLPQCIPRKLLQSLSDPRDFFLLLPHPCCLSVFMFVDTGVGKRDLENLGYPW